MKKLLKLAPQTLWGEYEDPEVCLGFDKDSVIHITIFVNNPQYFVYSSGAQFRPRDERNLLPYQWRPRWPISQSSKKFVSYTRYAWAFNAQTTPRRRQQEIRFTFYKEPCFKIPIWHTYPASVLYYAPKLLGPDGKWSRNQHIPISTPWTSQSQWHLQFIH